MKGREIRWPYWVISIGVVSILILLAMLASIGNGNSTDAHAASPSTSTGHTPTTPATSTTTTTTTTLPKVAVHGPALGVYVGPGAQDAVTGFSAAVNAPAEYALDYLDGSSWQTISDPQWILSKWKDSPYHMVFAVPMLAPGSTLSEGAAGTFDAEFHQLATNLVSAGFANSWLIIGSDPNSTSTPWHVDSTATASEYVSYWQQIVTIMRSVPGQSFHFVWDTTPLSNGLSPQDVYPGNASVDVIATDAFDADPTVPVAQGWSSLVGGTYGLHWFASFASHQGKPIMLAKWGLVPTNEPGGGGDDPAFVHHLLAWSVTNKVVVMVAWNYGSWAITGGAFPRSLATLRMALTTGAA